MTTTATIQLPKIELISAARCRITIGDVSRELSKVCGSGDSNTKLNKNSGDIATAADSFAAEYFGEVGAVETLGFSMLPHTLGGIGNVCPHASAGCAAACLNSTGLGAVFSNIQFGRLCRRMLWHNSRDWLLSRIDRDIHNAKRAAARRGATLAARLNVFSDIPWEKFGIVDNHPDVIFYDYTKNPRRVGALRPNYWTTFSRSEDNHRESLRQLAKGNNVAAVFHNPGRGYVGNRAGRQTLPSTFEGFPVFNADISDRRFDDPRGTWCGLKLKSPNTAQRNSAIDSGFSIPC